MKRLLLITLIVITCVLAGLLHGANLQEQRAGVIKPGHFPEKMPDVIFDATVMPSPLL